MKRTQTLFNLRTFFINYTLPYSKPALFRSLMDLNLSSDNFTKALRSLLKCPFVIPNWFAPKDFTIPDTGTSSLSGYSWLTCPYICCARLPVRNSTSFLAPSILRLLLVIPTPVMFMWEPDVFWFGKKIPVRLAHSLWLGFSNIFPM